MTSKLKNYVDRLEDLVNEAENIRKEKLLVLQKHLTHDVEHRIVKFYMNDEAISKNPSYNSQIVTGKTIKVPEPSAPPYEPAPEPSAPPYEAGPSTPSIQSPLLWQYDMPNSMVKFIDAFFDHVEKETKNLKALAFGRETNSSSPKGKHRKID